jgi:hypothetical protein
VSIVDALVLGKTEDGEQKADCRCDGWMVIAKEVRQSSIFWGTTKYTRDTKEEKIEDG